jgi:hypothetical protein
MERPRVAFADEQPARKSGTRHHFGPDATPQRNRKQASHGPKSERGRRKPIPEKKGGQFFGVADDEPYDETFMTDHGALQTNDPESDERP